MEAWQPSLLEENNHRHTADLSQHKPPPSIQADSEGSSTAPHLAVGEAPEIQGLFRSLDTYRPLYSPLEPWDQGDLVTEEIYTSLGNKGHF